MVRAPLHLTLVLNERAAPDVRATTSLRLGEVAREVGTDVVNRAISAALQTPLRHSIAVHVVGDRCLVLHVREPLTEKVLLARAG
jgi:hypothetical protein